MSAPSPGRPSVDISLVDARAFADLVDTAADVYGAAMNRAPDLVGQRRDIMADHVERQGFVAAVAMDGDRLIGFGYGYQGRPGEWWHDVVSAALGRERSREWLSDAFDLAELHVHPAHQGNGVGRELLDLVLGAAAGRTVVLSTHDSETVARALYRSVGFVDLLRDFTFPGSHEVYAVLGHTR
ncbi:MAG TPA: GNAT family N-acetyltransferase [Mycobacteriales bacterium]|nr:GNAT family N-acetyltransferase [Mycobacteriales bacterium]